ncbi:polysaccharide deacetylase family protein [Roseimaritima sediminicola]|uniref:polysaccharide deacetylase family protein n=1 Tax=Roseimaritima sediminicola TaxID=2662066 RepID=UPI00129852A5|nr:polysaccharide deacetylase family protein [Roseimaritima sediminicola]
MSLRSALLNARRLASLPLRRHQLRGLGAQGLAPLHCVFYHRVADTHPNDWTIGCAPFERHVRYMRSHFDMIDLSELQRRVNQLDSRRPAVAITFDDGYADNCRFALPLLMRLGVPCTYFVTVDSLLSGRPFPHDVQAGQPLDPHTPDEIRALAAGGIEIGLHTRSHLDLAGVTDPAILRHEIIDAADALADIVGRRIRYFAFPFGMPPQITAQAVDAVRQAGMDGFCSAFGAYNLPGRDAFHIRRFHGDPEFSRLLNWLQFDARKLRIEPSVAGSSAAAGDNGTEEGQASEAPHPTAVTNAV